MDVLAHEFSEWFYQLLNKDFLEGSSFALGAEHFWNDATLHMRVNKLGNQEEISLVFGKHIRIWKKHP